MLARKAQLQATFGDFSREMVGFWSDFSKTRQKSAISGKKAKNLA
jgi:hypothetical protein